MKAGGGGRHRKRKWDRMVAKDSTEQGPSLGCLESPWGAEQGSWSCTLADGVRKGTHLLCSLPSPRGRG